MSGWVVVTVVSRRWRIPWRARSRMAAGTRSELLAEFRTYHGPTMNAFEAAATNGREADLHTELEALFNDQNTSPSEDATSIPATFLRVTVAL